MGMFDYWFLCLLSSIFPSIYTVSFVLTLFLTLCSNSGNIQALRRATEEELKQHCSRCGKFGHNCLSCSMPMTDEWVLLLNIYPTIILIFVTNFWQSFFSFKSFTFVFFFFPPSLHGIFRNGFLNLDQLKLLQLAPSNLQGKQGNHHTAVNVVQQDIIDGVV